VSNDLESREDTAAALEAAELASARVPYVLQLFVAGTRARSLRAIANIKRICERYLEGRYQLDVVDLYQQPALAREAQILAAPTLVKQQPGPVRRIVGDLTDESRVLAGLGIRSRT
jgi:circadian clock protein KaiB